jgi:UDP-3-O-[3-hydroxymyristoyl] glucosamine N-acyltransferase
LALARIAELTGARLAPGSDGALAIDALASLDEAAASELAYASDRRYAAALGVTKAGACLLSPDLAASAPPGCAVLTTPDPRGAFAAVARVLYPDTTPQWPMDRAVAADAEIARDAVVAPSAVIGAKAVIGARAKIGPHAIIGPGVIVGADSVISAQVTLLYCLIGQRVIMHPGVRIGQDGFGFHPGATGLAKVPQLGRVIVHDDVEIGANCTIDRGALGDTVIGQGCKLDNLVQIGHNVVLGRHCVIVAQAGIAGSCTIGDGVVLGGQVGLADHVTVGAGAQIAAQSGVMRDVAPRETVMGYPARPIRQFWREIAALGKLSRQD